MDDYLKKLMQDLGEAINHVINESYEVNEAMDRLRAAGHNPFLMVEATIEFRERAELDDEPIPFSEMPIERRLDEISHEDRQFLKSLNIKFDSDE